MSTEPYPRQHALQGARHSPVLLTATRVYHFQLGGHVLYHCNALNSYNVWHDGNSEAFM